jgi:hypothetical protein
MKRRTIFLSLVVLAFLAAALLAGSLSASKAEAELGGGKKAQDGKLVLVDKGDLEVPPDQAPALIVDAGGRGSRSVTLLEEGFEDYQPGTSPWPQDWTYHPVAGSAYWAIYGSSPYSGDNHMGCTDDVVVDNWLVTSMLHVPAEGDAFEFYARAWYGETETWEVWINSDGNTVADFLSSGTMLGSDATSSSTYAHYSYPIPAQYHGSDVWFSIRCLSEDGHLFCVDNVTMPNLGYFEGFEGTPVTGFPPDGWTHEVVSGTDPDNEWQVSDGSNTHPSGVMPVEGSGMVEYDSYWTDDGNSARLITPAFDLSDPALNSVVFSFWMYHDTGYPNDDDRVEIQSSTDGSNWTTHYTYSRNNGSTGWDWHSFTVSSNPSYTQYYFGLTGISEYGNSIYVDYVKVYVYSSYDMQILDTTANIGGTVAVEVYGKWEEPMQAYQLGISFDDSKLAFNSLDFTGSITDSYSPSSGPMGDEMSPGFLSIGALWDPTSMPPGLSVVGSERLVTIVFDVIATEETVTELVLEDVSVYTYTDGSHNTYEASPYRASGTVVITEPTAVCGDADGNEIVNIADAVCLISYIFGGGPPPLPLCSGDCDGSGFLNISDAVHLIGYIFGGGIPPQENCCNPVWKTYGGIWTVASLSDPENVVGGKGTFTGLALGGRQTPREVLCGDANGSGSVNSLDWIYIMNYLFVHGSPAPVPEECVADVNGTGNVNIADAAYILNWLHGGPGMQPDCCIY